MTPKDLLFTDTSQAVKPFVFNEKVAGVFDDMADRSIPFYREVQQQSIFLLLSLVKDNGRIYDLGCATGNTILLLATALKTAGLSGLRITGYDSSAAMCSQAEKKLSRYNIDAAAISILRQDILKADLTGAGAVVMNYTLQFIPPADRQTLVTRIYQALLPGGILIVSDKTESPDPGLRHIFEEKYHAYKRSNGYSDLEIARKREALEDVLIPYNIPEAFSLFRGSGFGCVEIFFSWYNFTSFICVKQP